MNSRGSTLNYEVCILSLPSAEYKRITHKLPGIHVSSHDRGESYIITYTLFARLSGPDQVRYHEGQGGEAADPLRVDLRGSL